MSHTVQHTRRQREGYRPGKTFKKRNPQAALAPTDRHLLEKAPEKGRGPTRVTQPRHNLQVSFHHRYIN